MKKETFSENITLSLQFENMLSLLFGKENHHGDVGNMKKSEWKKNILKIINALEKGLNQNMIYTDQHQKSEFDNIIKQLKSKVSSAKTISQVNHDTLLGFTKLIFNLFGRFPYNLTGASVQQDHLCHKSYQFVTGFTNFNTKGNSNNLFHKSLLPVLRLD
jgi:hypothetical protein